MATTTDLSPPRRVEPELRLFASARDEQRLRRPLDVVTAVLALGLLAVLAWWAQPTLAFEQSLVDAVTSSPSWLHNLWVVAYELVVVMAVVAMLATVVRRRWPLLAQCVVAGGVAAALVVLVARYTSDDWVSFNHAFGWGQGVTWPASGITIACAVLLALSADVTAPARAAGRWAIGIAALAAVLAERSTPTGLIAALLAATAAAATARLVVGTAAGRVSQDEAVELLAAIGITGVRLSGFSRRSDGVVVIDADAEGGEKLLIKLVGRDVTEQGRIMRLWRSVMYRNGSAALALARVPGIQGEALTTLLAQVHGVPVWPVLTAGRQPGSAQELVLVVNGTRASQLPGERLDADFAAAAWKTLATLHDARIAHLHLGPSSIALRDDGTVTLTDFVDAASAADNDVVATDNAQLVVCLAVLTGQEVAVSSARAALDDPTLKALLPFLQAEALPHDLHAAAKAAKVDVDALRGAAAEAAGVEEPDLAKLRRVTLSGVAQMLLLVVAASAIISFFSKLDFGSLRSAFASATIALLIAGFVVAQLPRLTQAVTTIGSIPAQLRFLPVYMMQLASGFMNLAVPNAAGQAALSVRFFQRQGVPPATSVVAGLLNTLIGNLVQALLLGSLLIFTGLTLHLETDGSSGGGNHTLLIVLAVACVILVAALLVSRRLREYVFGKARAVWPDIKAAGATLSKRQNRGEVLWGSIATELLFASALALFVHAFGGHISLIEALFVNLTAALVVTFVPIPGGIGVAESALVLGLTGLGVSKDVAFASAISYRLSTYYLPPIWGALALRWLKSKKFV